MKRAMGKKSRKYKRNPWDRKYRQHRYIYLIRAGGSNWYKIGLSNDPSHRLLMLQTGNPYQLHLVGQWGPWHSRLAHTYESVIQKIAVTRYGATPAPGGKDWIKINAEPQDLAEAIERTLHGPDLAKRPAQDYADRTQ